MIGKAPAGGIVSHVNGQFYQGGQFTPDHGKLCGRGKNKVTIAEYASAKAELESLGYQLEYIEKRQLFLLTDERGVRMAESKTPASMIKSHGIEQLRAQYERNEREGYSSHKLRKLPG